MHFVKFIHIKKTIRGKNMIIMSKKIPFSNMYHIMPIAIVELNKKKIQ